MTRSERIFIRCVGVLALTAVVFGGDLNPPAGPVSPTGRTTDEIFNAVVAAPEAPIPDPPMPDPDGPGGQILFLLISGIPGSSMTTGRETWIDASAIDLITTSRDCGELRLRIDIDRSASTLVEAARSGAVIGDVTFEIERQNPNTGQREVAYRIELTVPTVTRYRMLTSGREAEVVFAYNSAAHTWLPGGAIPTVVTGCN